MEAIPTEDRTRFVPGKLCGSFQKQGDHLHTPIHICPYYEVPNTDSYFIDS